MNFLNVNYLALALAVVAGMIVGAIWYGVLAKQWMKAANVGPDELDQQPTLYIIAAACLFIMAWMMSGILIHFGTMSLMGGLNMGAFLWLGFVVTTITVNHRFQGSSWGLTFINCGHWLAVLLVQGAIIGWMGF
jgi:hypothetical protein